MTETRTKKIEKPERYVMIRASDFKVIMESDEFAAGRGGNPEMIARFKEIEKVALVSEEETK